MKKLSLQVAFALALSSLCAPALAQPPVDPAEPVSPEPAKPEPAKPEPPKPEPTKQDQAPTLGPLERLPPSAFPEPRVRGIEGGSLRTTFHGLQWPYYPKTGIGISGYGWIDSGYERIKRGNPSEQSLRYWLQQGRLLLRVTPTWSDGTYFIQGQAEIVANKDQSLHQPDIGDTDDVWIKAGKWNAWDVQLGRYEAWEIYHFGMGLDLYTLERRGASDETLSAPEIYGVSYAFYRPAGVGQGAIHLYPTDYLRFELGTQFGNEFGSNVLAARPVGVLDLGWLKLKLGAEYKKLADQKEDSKGETKQRGAGGSLQFVVAPYVEFGVSGAYGLVDRVAQDGTVDEKGSNTTYSMGAFANARVVQDLTVGAGINYTYLEDLHFDPALNRVEKFAHYQAFGALQYLLVKQLYLKAVFAYAKADFAPTFGDPVFKNEMLSARLRMLFLF